MGLGDVVLFLFVCLFVCLFVVVFVGGLVGVCTNTIDKRPCYCPHSPHRGLQCESVIIQPFYVYGVYWGFHFVSNQLQTCRGLHHLQPYGAIRTHTFVLIRLLVGFITMEINDMIEVMMLFTPLVCDFMRHEDKLRHNLLFTNT